jgi:hypothetical protein
MKKRKHYVVVTPVAVRGYYDDWSMCMEAMKGIPGRRLAMQVESREEAEAILSGKGVVLPEGSYAFTDGNHKGGVGIALVLASDNEADLPRTTREIATSVFEAFEGEGIDGLQSRDDVETALSQLRNHLAEVAGLYVAVREVPAGHNTIVHDHQHLGDWMRRDSQPWDERLANVVSAARHLEEERGLELDFRIQHGHRSDWAGRHDLANLNRLADHLAARGISGPLSWPSA